jgi:hypothetical protein
MKGRERIPIVVLAAAFALASAACRPSQTVERQTDDAAIEAKIKAKLAADVGAATITSVEVNVTNGVVTLAGPVSSAEERQKIETAARSVEGVVSVTNNIQVSGTQVPPPQPATTSAPTTPAIKLGKPVFFPIPTATPKP